MSDQGFAEFPEPVKFHDPMQDLRDLQKEISETNLRSQCLHEACLAVSGTAVHVNSDLIIRMSKAFEKYIRGERVEIENEKRD